MFTVAFATPLPDARSVAGWIDGSDRPSCREAARAPPLCSLSPDLPDRENPAQILVGLVPQWPDVICPYGRLRCGLGVVCNFLRGTPESFTQGGLVAVSHEHPKSNLAIAQEQSTKVSYAKQHPQSILQHFSNSVINKQQASKQNMAPTP